MISKKSLITIGCTAAVAVIALGAVFVFGGNGEDSVKLVGRCFGTGN